MENEYKIDSCKKNFLCNLTVYVHKGKDPNVPMKNPKSYLYSNFSFVHVIKAVTGNKTTTRFKLSYSGQYITFGISAKAVDATVFGIKMFFYYCEGTFINNIYFPNTTSSVNQPKAVNGSCSKNSKFLNNGTEFEAFCLQNGTWTRRSDSECLCVGGFESRLSQGCQRKYICCQCNKNPIIRISKKPAHKNLYYMVQATSSKIASSGWLRRVTCRSVIYHIELVRIAGFVIHFVYKGTTKLNFEKLQ